MTHPLSNTPDRLGCRVHWLALAAILTAWTMTSQTSVASGEDDFSRQLYRVTPEIMDKLRSRGCKHVGVLKFHVCKSPSKTPSDDVGTLNMFAAQRLEIALALHNPHVADEQIGIVQNASAVAATIPGASHVTAAGRAKLFTGGYQLAWGAKQDITPDAFLTGLILVDESLTKMSVGVFAFDRQNPELRSLVQFDVQMTPGLLDELGESFLLRGAFDGGQTQINKPVTKAEIKKETVKAAQDVKAKKASFPLVDKSAPVALEVLYDGRPQALDLNHSQGEAFLAEPHEGQDVTFVLSRTPAAKGRLGVMLKVNGENTLFREKLAAEHCMKWILEPDGKPIKIIGYQLTDDRTERFHVLSSAESKAHEVNYGAEVGIISLVVFREQTNDIPLDLPPLEELEKADDLLALMRGVLPEKTPNNLAALQAQLRSRSNSSATRHCLCLANKRSARFVGSSSNHSPNPS